MGKDAAKLTLSKVLTLIITLATNMMLSRVRTLEEYGTFSQLLMVVNLFVAIFSLGLPNCINYFIPRSEKETEKREFVETYYTSNTVLGIITGCLLVSIIPVIVAYFNNEMIKQFWFVLAFLPLCTIIMSSINNLLVVYKRTTKLVVYNLITAVILFSAIIVTIVIDTDFFGYMCLFILAEVILTVWTYIIAIKLAKGVSIRINGKLLKAMLIYSIPLGLATSISTLNSELDKLIIGNLLSTEGVALYTNAAKELPISIIPASLTAILMPFIVKALKDNDYKKAIDNWASAIEIGYIFLCFFSMVCIAYAPQVITILYSEKYLPCVSVFRVYSIVVLLRVTYFGMLLNAIGKTKFILYTTIASLGLNCIMNYLFFYLFGFIGPAVATFTSILLIQMIQLGFSSKLTGIPFSQIFPWRNLGKITLINMTFCFVSLMVLRYYRINTSTSDITKAIFFGLIISIVYFLIEYKDIKMLWMKLNRER